MKRVNIFLSTDNQASEYRKELGNYIRSINDLTIKRGVFFDIFPKENETDYLKEIENCDLFFMLVLDDIDKQNRVNFNEALETFKAKQVPKIVPYLKEKEQLSEHVKEFMQYLDKDLGHFYKQFDHMDTLRLGIVMHIKNFGFDDVKCEDGCVTLDGEQVLKLDNINIFTNGDKIKALKEKLATIEEEYYKVKYEYDKTKKTDDNKEAYSKLEQEYYKLQKEREDIKIKIASIQKDLFDLMQEFDSIKHKSAMLKKAEDMLATGSYLKVNSILDMTEIEKDIKECNSEDVVKIKTTIDELLLKARVSDIIGNKNEQATCYKYIASLVQKYNVRYDALIKCAEYKKANGHQEEALKLCKIVESYYLVTWDNQTILDKYQLYLLMGNLYYSMNNLDKAKSYHTTNLNNVMNTKADLPEIKRYNMLCNVYYSAYCIYQKGNDNDVKLSKEYLTKAVEYAEKTYQLSSSYSLPLLNEYSNMFYVLENEKKYDESEEYLNKHTSLLKTLENKIVLYQYLDVLKTNLYMQSLYYENKNDYKLAQRKRTEIAEIFKRDRHNLSDIAWYNYSMGNFFVRRKDYKTAITFLNVAVKQYNELFEVHPKIYWDEVYDCYKSLSNCYRKLHDVKKSVEVMKKAVELSNRIIKAFPELSTSEILKMIKKGGT